MGGMGGMHVLGMTRATAVTFACRTITVVCARRVDIGVGCRWCWGRETQASTLKNAPLLMFWVLYLLGQFGS